MNKPRLLDLFCGAGGCSMGYHNAGFDVVGVDHVAQPNYPYTFVEADALGYLADLLNGFWNDGRGFAYHAIHASPPCQRYSRTHAIHGSGASHPDMIGRTRGLLQESGVPWVIENVSSAPMRAPAIELCGLMFGLRVLRHRWFESSLLLFAPPHPKHPKHLRTGTQPAKRGGKGNGYSTGEQGLVCVAGNNFVRQAGADAMGIDWRMTRRELANAIPPSYTEYVGKQLLAALSR